MRVLVIKIGLKEPMTANSQSAIKEHQDCLINIPKEIDIACIFLIVFKLIFSFILHTDHSFSSLLLYRYACFATCMYVYSMHAHIGGG